MAAVKKVKEVPVNETTSEVSEVTPVEAVKEKKSRVRRVTSDITLPKDGSLIGTITMSIVGVNEPVVYEANFGAFTDDFIQQAALAGLASRLGIAYSGKQEPKEIIEAINKEIENFNNNKYVSRSTTEKKINAPDIVIAWMIATNADPDNKELLAKYVSSWQSRNDGEKDLVQKNLKVAAALEKLQSERRLAKKAKDAIQDDSALQL